MTDLNADDLVKLLPCPFCGSAFLMGQEPHDNHPFGGMFYIFHEYGPLGSDARKCPIDVRRHFDSAIEAATAWNRRSAMQGGAEPVAWVDPKSIAALQDRRRWTTVIMTNQRGENATTPLYTHPSPVNGAVESVKADYVLVPRKPTEAMIEAGFEVQRGANANQRRAIWDAMVNAAPTLATPTRIREALETLVTINDEHAPFGGELYHDRIDRAWDAARLALATPTPAVTVDHDSEWVTVPRKLTVMMTDALDSRDEYTGAEETYENMLAAAPTPPTSTDVGRMIDFIQRLIKDGCLQGLTYEREALAILSPEPSPQSGNAVDEGWKPIIEAVEHEVLWLFEPHSMGGFMFSGIKLTDGTWINTLDQKEQHPTHWKPLPSAPSTPKHEEGGK